MKRGQRHDGGEGMSVRQKIVDRLRESIESSNTRAALKFSEMVSSITGRPHEDDAYEISKVILEVIEVLPNLVMFVGNLIIDPRVPVGEKIRIGVLAAYIVAPTELILTQLVGPVAFMDEVFVIAYLVYSVVNLIGQLDEEIVRDNWPGNADYVQHIHGAARALAGLGSFQSVIRRQEQFQTQG